MGKQKLYFIAGSQDKGPDAKSLGPSGLLRVLREALQAGIDYFQFRDKGDGSLEERLDEQKELARACQELCQLYRVPFIVNDSLDLALELNSDGIHVGQSDQPIDEVLAAMASNKIVGLTVSNEELINQYQYQPGLSYLGLGPVFPTKSKEKKSGFLGIAGLTETFKRNYALPIYAIAGIDESNSQSVLQTGVDGICVISAICQSQNIAQTIMNLKGRPPN